MAADEASVEASGPRRRTSSTFVRRGHSESRNPGWQDVREVFERRSALARLGPAEGLEGEADRLTIERQRDQGEDVVEVHVAGRVCEFDVDGAEHLLRGWPQTRIAASEHRQCAPAVRAHVRALIAESQEEALRPSWDQGVP